MVKNKVNSSDLNNDMNHTAILNKFSVWHLPIFFKTLAQPKWEE